MDILTVPVVFEPKGKPSHTILVRSCSPKESSKRIPHDRSLRLLNIPSFCTATHLKQAFSKEGDRESVEFSAGKTSANKFSYETPEKPEGFKSGFLVFKKKKFLYQSVKNTKSCTVGDKDVKITAGLTSWCEAYKRIYPAELIQEDVDTFMKQYDNRKAKQDAARKKEEANPTDDGWTVVSYKRGARAPLKKDDEVLNEKRQKKTHTHFYPFQFRLKRLNEIDRLRDKYTRDKLRIEEMKKSRKFRPFKTT